MDNIWSIKNDNLDDLYLNKLKTIGSEKFRNEILCVVPAPEMIEKQERAFNALLAYERNCQKHEAKYIDPRMAKIPKGEHMSDFAMKYGTTVKEMKEHWRQVEHVLNNE